MSHDSILERSGDLSQLVPGILISHEKDNIPLLIECEKNTNLSNQWRDYHQVIQKIITRYQRDIGAILFRGFKFIDDNDFYDFVKSFGLNLLRYEFGSTPRSHLGNGVYTSTEYPAHQVIPLHNEQAYTLSWPLNIWFHCVTAASRGGHTPIADSRLIYQHINRTIRERFEKKRLMYVRNYGNGLDIPWQQAFNTDDISVAQAYAKNNKIQLEWKEDGELRTRQLCQATAQHPLTNEWVWFNQAHLFHISNLNESVREMLLGCVDMQDLPRNVYYGDGSEIETSILDEIRGVIDEFTVSFPWQPGDVMLLDNMLVAHGRGTFEGERKVVVAMTEPFDSIAANGDSQNTTLEDTSPSPEYSA